MTQPPKIPGTISTVGTLPVVYLHKALNVCRELEFDPSAIIKSEGLEKLLDEPEKSLNLSIDCYYQCINQLLTSFHIPGLGFRTGLKFTVADYGLLGYALLSCKNLRQGMEVYIRYQEIIGSKSQGLLQEFRVENNEGVFSTCSQAPNKRIRRHEIEESIAQFSRTELLLGRPLPINRIHFSFPEPPYIELYQEVFQCPLIFDQPVTEVYFPESLLEESFAMANEVVSASCQQQCQQILEHLEKQGGLVEQVRKLVVSTPGTTPVFAFVANELAMSSRTLRRRLQAENSSYQEIVNEVRMTIATEYLKSSHLSTQEIAYLLGYSEATGFYRAFRKRLGMTPSEYREQINR